jgi:hypothetical protein
MKRISKKRNSGRTIILALLGFLIVVGVVVTWVLAFKGVSEVLEVSEDRQKAWESGMVVSGTAVKVQDYFSIGEQLLKKSQNYMVELHYTVDGKEYSETIKFDSETFDRLDDENNDGVATVEIHYDPENPAIFAVAGMGRFR